MNTPSVIFEDDYLLALNKPSGWVVNDSNTVSTNPVLQDWISQNLNFEIASSKELRSGIVHRLDKETSGIILVAKTSETFFALQKQFADRKIEKTYIALVHGKVKEKEGLIDAPVGRLPWKRTKFGVFDGGRPAQTYYKVLEYFDNLTLLELHPKTGRTHQIRVHLKHIGHSIVSDPLYAGRKVNRKDRTVWPHLFLHASEIKFTHPITKNQIHLKAPLPEELKLF